MNDETLPADLLDLLERWAARHPQECRAVTAPSGGRLGFHLLTQARPAGHFVTVKPGEADLWIIEGAALRAIADAGYHYEVKYRYSEYDVTAWTDADPVAMPHEAFGGTLACVLIALRLWLPDAG